jgi:hypothetical protein
MCAFAFVAGLAFLPLPGLHYDEILFLHPFLNDWALYRNRLFGQEIPLMLMSYVGALKTWLYWPLYTWLPPSVWVVRLPTLLVGCANIWLIYRLGGRLWNPRAGVLAAALAATDPTFLLTHVFDWGPIAIQVLLSLLAALAFLRWKDSGATRWLAACGFCCGLAQWNKAIFGWILVSVVIAAAICWPRILLLWRHIGHFRPQVSAIVWAVACFLVGAAPFISYNLSSQSNTVRDIFRFESTFPAHKLSAAHASLAGNHIASSIGFSAVWQGECTDGSLQSLSGRTPIPARLQLFPESTWTPYALLAGAILLLCFWKQPAGRTGLFMLLVFAVHCGLAMASIRGGTGMHHYAPVLPAVFLAIGGAWTTVLAWVERRTASSNARRVILAVAVFLPVLAAATLCGWWQRATYCGCQDIWSDASQKLASRATARPEQRFYAVDWGIDPQAIYLSEKRGNVKFLGVLVDGPVENGPKYEEAAAILADPATRLVSFRPGAEIIAEHKATLMALLEIHDCHLVHEDWITDSSGRSVYAVWRLEPGRSRVEKQDDGELAIGAK